MKILGLSSGFHDSSAALVIDGKLVASAAEERFTRQKHDAHFPRFATDYCLRQAGLQVSDLDRVVYYERPVDKWIRVTESSLAHWPRGKDEFVESQIEWLGKKLWTRAGLSARFGLSPERILEIPHHTSHLLQSFVGSSFDRAAVLTVDAVGERATAAMAELFWDGGKVRIRALGEAVFPQSLGLFYSAMTAFLGFKPMNDECTTMALAAFGQPRFIEKLRRVITFTDDGFWRIDPQFLDFDRFLEAPWSEAFIELFGTPRLPTQPLSWTCLGENRPSASDRYWADLAASVQAVLEEALLHSARHLRGLVSTNRLCLGGGVAMNCVANSRLARESGFTDLFIPVEPGDGGASIGAAFAGEYFLRAEQIHVDASPAHACTYPVSQGQIPNEDLNWLEHIDSREIEDYQKHGRLKDRRAWRWEKCDDQSALSRQIAGLLAEGQVVGLVNGGFELGPRALGHRSILFRPDRIELAKRVSEEIKDRAPYRPYALVLLEDEAEKILIDPPLVFSATPMQWMQLAVGVQAPFTDRVRAGLHCDGTTRPQVVSRRETRLIASILCAFQELTGLGALVNTSFNEAGYPLVTSAEEAMHVFARTSLDAVVIGSTLVRKV